MKEGETVKTWSVQIGTINSQWRYKVKAQTEKIAKDIAVKRHKELGRDLSGKGIFATRIR